MKAWIVTTVAAALALGGAAARAQARCRALEISPERAHLLPVGKEADGIAGDFVLENERLAATISAGDLRQRKANMSTFWAAPTPGCLYDLMLRDAPGDQLVILAPARQEGAVSSVHIVEDGSAGRAVIRAERSSAADGIARTHDYVLGAGWSHLAIRTRLVNDTPAARTVDTRPRVEGLAGETTVGEITVARSQDPWDAYAYAWAPAPADMAPGTEPPRADRELAPGAEVAVEVWVAAGRSAAEAVGILRRAREPDRAWALVAARAVGSGGDGVPRAELSVAGEGVLLPGWTLADGSLPPFAWPAGLPCAIAARTLGREAGRAEITPLAAAGAGELTNVTLALGPPCGLALTVTDDAGRAIPCRARFCGVAGTADPVLGPDIRARGGGNEVHSPDGRIVQELLPGQYRVIVTRGPEYDHFEQVIHVRAGEMAALAVTLRRVVDTTGWVSADFHNHSTPSGDNFCGTDDRLIDLAAEHVEFAPATEHNRFCDWQPQIQRLGLSGFLSTVVGIELTGAGPHLNAFPFDVKPFTQDNGAPRWDPDPRIDALLLKNWQGFDAERWVQLNHPDVGACFRDRDGDGRADGGFAGLSDMIDGAEVYGEQILLGAPTYAWTDAAGKEQTRRNRAFEWLQLLNQGARLWAVATADAHDVTENGVGGWRTYIPSATDDPRRIDARAIIRQARAGRMVVTNGPFLDVSANDGEARPGDLVVGLHPVRLHVRVEQNTWVDVDRVQVLVNGRPWPELDFRRAARPELFRPGPGLVFEHRAAIALQEDAHLIVVAFGEGSTLEKGWGAATRQGRMHPCAYSNPIYVDLDGKGWTPSGDTLDHPLP